MSSQSSVPTASTQTPAVRSFQMDGSSQGNLASSVNLFRGDVNLSQTLFTLPGRSQANALDVSLTVQYQSNVFRSATSWNADAPTGVLGLGWNLPLTWIEAVDNGSPVAATRQYMLFDNGSPNGLFQQAVRPQLFKLAGNPSGSLRDGSPVPEQVRGQFLANGLALSVDATISGSGPWLIDDDALMQQFQLVEEGAALIAYDGGDLYQLQNYQFWKVIYYPNYERWLIVSDQGVRRSFGGRTADTDKGFATALGNAVAWSVWWTDGGSQPVWTGSSAQTTAQVQIARAWYLTTLSDRFGSTVRFAYNAGTRDANGIIPVVEQQVGNGGKPYTKAVYLSSVVDSYGRKVSFNYADKLWDAAPSSPREFHDPHSATPSNAPGPYQDRYETRYLASVDVDDPAGARMFSIGFTFEPRPDSPVANVTSNSGSLEGDTYKRFLTAIVQYDQDGVASPGLLFAYDLALATPGGQPGALLSVTYPQGGVARYTYSSDQQLVLAERSTTAARPSAVPQGATPRVYFGSDYAAVCYYNQNSLQLSLQVYTWTGSWLQWQLQADSALIDSGGLTLATLAVQAAADFLTLRFNRSSGELAVYVFQRDTARPGQWQAATIDAITTAPNQPTLTYSTRNVSPRLYGGSTFFVVSQMDSATSSGSYDVVTWRWSTRRWTRQTVAVGYAWLTAAAEYYAVLDMSGKLQLFYLDGVLQWQSAAPAQISGLATDNLDAIELTPGSGLLVVSNLTSSNAQQNTYRQWIAEWDAVYAITLSSYGPYTDWFGSGNAPLGWTPTIVENALIGTNGNLLRRNGSTWSENTALNLGGNPPANTAVRYAYGSSYAIRMVVPTAGVGAPAALVQAFDPTQANPWVGPTSIAQTLPGQTTSADNFPSAGGDDWAVIGPYLYYRGTATSWASVVSTDASANLDDVVSATGSGNRYQSESLVDQAPTFLAYGVQNGPNQSVQALILQNGGLAGAPLPFANEKLAPGSESQGPQLFVSFPAQYSSFDQAQSVLLHRYAGFAVDGPIVHYAVVRVEMDDGFGDPIPTSFVPDPSTASADASGNIVKYYQNTVYPGTQNPATATAGHVVNRYLNGVEDLTGDNYYDMLDGLLISTATYAADGMLVASSSTTWTVIEEVASSATDAGAAPVLLRGGWVTATAQVDMSDGVTTTTTTAYVSPGLSLPYSGQPTSRTRSNYGGDGTAESFTSLTRYGVEFEVYQALVAIHALADSVQVSSSRSAAGTTVPLAANATTYASWASNAGEGVLTPAPEAGFGLLSSNDTRFPFASYTPGASAAGWQLSARTTARTPYGNETGNVDALGNPTATLYDAQDELAVARIANAAPGGCAYLGFQSYESTAGWTLTGISYDQNDTYTGTRSAVLPGSAAASIGCSVTPTTAQTYVLGCRYRTPTGFTADGSGLAATVTIGAGQPQTVKLAWAATDERWIYVTLPIPVAGDQSGAIVICVAATNTTASDVHIDSMLLTPLVTGATIRSFDPDSQQILSAMDASGRTSRTYYDRSYRASVSVGSAGLVREISTSFLSRQGSVNDAFEAASPNAELTLHSSGGGILESFRDGGLWATRWLPSNANAWQVEDGALTHAGSSSDSLTWSQRPSGTYAVYFEVEAGNAAQISVAAGDVRVGWSGTAWMASQGTNRWTALAQPPAIATRWLLVVGDGVVLFFGNGQLLYSERVRPNAGAVVISAAGACSTFRNLTGVTGIRLGLSYNDAGGRQRQIHQLHGNDSLLCELLFDPLDRQLATSKSAPGSFGSGATLATLSYRPSFVDVAAFLSATATDWTMRGDVADYYAGQTEGGVTRSNDQGYPYWGTRYEASPRSVKLETSLPGKDYAINLLVPPAQRQTTQFSYSANSGSDPSLPAQQYSQTQVSSAVKTLSTQINDKLGQQVATTFDDASGALVNQSAGARSYAAPDSGPIASILQQLPNALIAGPQSGDAAFTRTTVANSLQETTSVSDPDSGQTQFIFDSVGNLRFVQPAMDVGAQWYIYYRYDAIGRLVEEGTVQGAWDPARLDSLADDPSWPVAGRDGASAQVVIAFDGPGDQPKLLGMKWMTTTTNAVPALTPAAAEITVVETFGYDTAGNITSVRQDVAGAVTASGTIGYAYDQLGDVVQLTLPDGSPIARLYYSYDDQGNVIAIGSSPGGSEFGSFGYSAENQPTLQTTGVWKRIINYDSVGRIGELQTNSTDGSDQSLGFTLTYDADGAMASRAVSFNFAEFSSNHDDVFGYDDQRRLSSASGASDVKYTLYDADGNLWRQNHAGSQTDFGYAQGNNLLTSLQADGGTPGTLAYDARGQQTSGLGRNLNYDDATGMTTAIATADATLRLAYGAAQQRVVRQHIGGSTRIDFMGAGRVPVASLVDGQWALTIHGPTGLLAWVSDRSYNLLTDTTQSVWAVVADGQLVGARTYLPFGMPTFAHGKDPVPYAFQGQVWDAEVALYDFRTRMYDPALARFLTPDPQRQFASPYVFANNSPLIIIDPTGEISIWAQVGIGVALVAITALGIGLTLFTGGASDAAAASADAALLGAAGAAEGATAVAEGGAAAAEAGAAAGAIGADAGTGAAAVGAAGAESSAAAGASASAEVAAGVTTAESASSASSFSFSSFGVNLAGSTLSGAGTSGLSYDIQHGRDFTAKGFFEAVGIGAASGFVSGAVGGALSPVSSALTEGLSGASGVLARAATGAATGAISSALSSDVKTVLTNLAQHQPWYQGLLKSTLQGAATGAAIGAGGSLGKSAFASREAIAAKAASKGLISDQTVQKVATLPQLAKAAAASDVAIAGYILAGFFIPAGYVVWGAATGFKT